jgi:hypothetical protein
MRYKLTHLSNFTVFLLSFLLASKKINLDFADFLQWGFQNQKTTLVERVNDLNNSIICLL